MITEKQAIQYLLDEYNIDISKYTGIVNLYENLIYKSQKEVIELFNHLEALPKLTSLILENNDFHKPPSEIGKLKNLVTLFLDKNNNLTELPPEIGKLENLQIITLPKNRPILIPPEIKNLKKLYIYWE